MITVDTNPNRRVLHNFGWAMLGGFVVLGVLLWLLWWRKAPEDARLLEWLGAGPQIAAVICWALGPLLWILSRSPISVARPVYVGWMTGATWIGAAMTTVVFSILFVVVLPVFSLIRLADPMRKRLRPDGTYWEDHKPHAATLERMMRPF